MARWKYEEDAREEFYDGEEEFYDEGLPEEAWDEREEAEDAFGAGNRRGNRRFSGEEARYDSYDGGHTQESRGEKRLSVWNAVLLVPIVIVCIAIAAVVLGNESSGEEEAAEETEVLTEETDAESDAVSDAAAAEEAAEEEEEEPVDLSDIDEVLAGLNLAIEFDGTLFDETWYLEELAAAGITEVTSESSSEEIYRHYQLYGRGDSLSAYDTSALDETTVKKLAAYEESLRAVLIEEYDAAWLTVTADIYDSEEVTFWNTEYTLSEEASGALSQSLALFEDDGYEVGFVILDLTTGEAAAYNAGIEVYSASVIKAPYIFSLIDAGYEPTDEMYLAGNQSDNEAYQSLRETYGSTVFSEWIEGTGIPSSQGSHWYITTTPLDLARMFYKGKDLLLGDQTYSDWARNTFTDSLNSAAALTIGTSKTVYSKAGWISETDGYHSYTNAAIVDGDNPYIVVMMSDSLGYVGLEYAQVLLPVLDQIHEEMCGLTADFSGLDYSVGDLYSGISSDTGSGGEDLPDIDDSVRSDGAPGMGEEGTPDYVEPGDDAGGGGAAAPEDIAGDMEMIAPEDLAGAQDAAPQTGLSDAGMEAADPGGDADPGGAADPGAGESGVP